MVIKVIVVYQGTEYDVELEDTASHSDLRFDLCREFGIERHREWDLNLVNQLKLSAGGVLELVKSKKNALVLCRKTVK